MASVLPLAIAGSHRFYDTLTNFLGLISYWAGAFVAIILIEHFVFRRHFFPRQLSSAEPPSTETPAPSRAFASYPVPSPSPEKDGYVTEREWRKLLPSGIPAIVAGLLSVALIVPTMDQVLYTGPIAAMGTGDIGFEMAFAVAGIGYLVLRWMEVRIRGGL